jgi:cell division protease FtsH
MRQLSDEVSAYTNEAQPFLGYELAQTRDYSEATAARIDEDMQRLIEQAHTEAHLVLMGARTQLDELAALLCKEETVSADMLTHILGPRKTKLAVGGGGDGALPERSGASD